MRVLLSLLLLLCSCFSLNARESLIAGTVTDASMRPVVAATVSLLRASDSSWLQSVLTNDSGQFQFTAVQGKLLLDVSAAGYQHKVVAWEGKAPQRIIVEPISNALAEVVIKSHVPAIRSSLGKLTVNFDQATVTGSDNVLDLLRRSPGVQIDGLGHISMNGKSVVVFVEGRQSYLSGQDLTNYLKSIPAATVAQLELQSQPSARYDAAGDAGVVDIILKKNRKPGWNGSLNSSYTQGVYPNVQEQASLNFKKGKVTAYGSLGFFHATGFLDQLTHSFTRDTSDRLLAVFQERSFRKEVFEDYRVQLGGSYAFTDSFSVSGNLNGVYHPNAEMDFSASAVNDLVKGQQFLNETHIDQGLLRKYLEGSLMLESKLLGGRKLTAQADGFMWSQKNRQDLSSQITDPQTGITDTGTIFRSDAPHSINLVAVRADYEASISGALKIESGAKASFLQNHTAPVFESFSQGQWAPGPSRSNDFTYSEHIYAGYASAVYQHKKLELKGGLRYEYTVIDGLQRAGNTRFHQSFGSLFPTFFIAWQFNDAHRLEFNYGRRIQRPSYRELNPFVRYRSQYATESGNSNLLPQFRQTISLRHNYKNTVFTEIGGSKSTNLISPELLYDQSAKVVLETLRNYGMKYNLHAGINLNKEMYPWWNLSSSYDYYFNEYRDEQQQVLASSVGQSLALSNELRHGQWSLFLVVQYNSGDLQSLTERNAENIWMEATLSRKMLRDTATLKLSVQDPFRLYHYRPTAEWKGVRTESDLQFATQNLALAFSYNFGQHLNIRRQESKTEEAGRL